MCKDTCNKCNECNPCDRKCNQQDCGCKFEVDAMCVRYTKNDLECSGLPKGTILEDIIEAFDRKLCETGDVNQVVVAGGDNVTVDTSVDGNTTTYTVNAQAGGNQCNDLYLSLDRSQPDDSYNITPPQIVITGGATPYTYKWSLQQDGGIGGVTIGDSTTANYLTMFSSLTGGTQCTGSQTGSVPCRVSYVNGLTDPNFAFHFKLEVTDANGCTVKDYWTQYYMFTY